MAGHKRFKRLGLLAIIVVASAPLAIITTILSSPIWSWFEQQFAIEAYGHSGPAAWCYLLTYAVFVLPGTLWVIKYGLR